MERRQTKLIHDRHSPSGDAVAFRCLKRYFFSFFSLSPSPKTAPHTTSSTGQKQAPKPTTMNTLPQPQTNAPNTTGPMITPTALLKLIHGRANLRPSDLFSQALDTLLLDMLEKLFPTEYVRFDTMEEIRLFAAKLMDAQLRVLGVPERYWWHLRNLPVVSCFLFPRQDGGFLIFFCLFLRRCKVGLAEC